jgi:DNA (cytosine-5)-methyltransferase 1
MNELALFAGAGGGTLAAELLGIRTICAVEIVEFAKDRLAQRQNEHILEPFPIWDDIRTFDGRPWKGEVDIISGGFPCQPFSTATHGKPTATDLWPEMLRIIEEVEAPLVFAENVSIRAISKAAYDCDRAGYKTITAGISASDVGADHNRPRYWLLAYPNMRSKLPSTLNVQASGVSEFNPRVWSKAPEGWETGEDFGDQRHGLKKQESELSRPMGENLALQERTKSSSESDRSRVDDGVAGWMDRYKTIGNGQVSCVAATAFYILMLEAGLV